MALLDSSTNRTSFLDYDSLFPKSPLLDNTTPTPEKLRERYYILIQTGVKYPDQQENLKVKLKMLILAHGIPDDEKLQNVEDTSTLRGKIWQILLGVTSVNSAEYRYLLSDKAGLDSADTAAKDELIRVDSERTFATEYLFPQRAPKEKVERVLLAFHRKMRKERFHNYGYLQGVNAVAGFLLFHMPELEAFTCLFAFYNDHCPRYCKEFGGSHEGRALVLPLLEEVDKPLHNLLSGLQDAMTSYTQSIHTSLATAFTPYTEAFKLFDVVMAFGVHMVTIFCISALVVRRKFLLECEKPRDFFSKSSEKAEHAEKPKEVEASVVISIALQIIPLISPRSYRICTLHPWKPLAHLQESSDEDLNIPDCGLIPGILKIV